MSILGLKMELIPNISNIICILFVIFKCNVDSINIYPVDILSKEKNEYVIDKCLYKLIKSYYGLCIMYYILYTYY